MKTLIVLFSLSLLLITAGCNRQPVEDKPIPSGDSRVVNLTHPMARKFLFEHQKDDNLVILDVRTPEEYAQDHLPGAILVNFNSPGFAREIAKLDPKKTYFVYCHSGGRSAASLPVLLRAGISKIYHLQRGVVMGYPFTPQMTEKLKKPGQIELGM